MKNLMKKRAVASRGWTGSRPGCERRSSTRPSGSRSRYFTTPGDAHIFDSNVVASNAEFEPCGRLTCVHDGDQLQAGGGGEDHHRRGLNSGDAPAGEIDSTFVRRLIAAHSLMREEHLGCAYMQAPLASEVVELLYSKTSESLHTLSIVCNGNSDCVRLLTTVQLTEKVCQQSPASRSLVSSRLT